MTTCKNCAQEFEGNYCPACGQKSSTRRFSTKIVFAELVDKLLPLDQGILFTSKHLITRPGAMMRDYLDGKRAKFSKPLQFLLLMVAISLIFFSQEDFLSGMKDGMNSSDKSQKPGDQEVSKLVTQWISDYMTALIVGIVPFTALVARWLFRMLDLNFAEHIVINCYLIGGGTLMGMPIMLATKLMGEDVMSATMTSLISLVYIGYFIWGYIGIFKDYGSFSTGFKASVSFLLGYLIYIITMMILVISIILVYRYF